MKMFGGEGLGRPELEAASLQKDVLKAFQKQFPAEKLPEIKVAFVFTHPKVKISVEDAPIPTLAVDKLKDFVRKTKKVDLLPQDQVEEFAGFIETTYSK